MGMTQKEIEALMNGLDAINKVNEDKQSTINIDEIEKLISQNKKADKIHNSSEKSSKIINILNSTLSNNNETREKLNSFKNYIYSNFELFNSLSSKFPNIEIFKAQIDLAEDMSNNLKNITNILDAEDKKIIELIHLIKLGANNSEEIDKGIAVIRKLSLYLNRLLEEKHSIQDIKIEKRK
jgi:hypothetical protein